MKRNMSKKKKKICWITSSFLLDVDIPIVPALQKDYDIDWIILSTKANKEGDKALIERTGCENYKIITDGGLFIHPKKILFYKKLLTEIKQKDYDLYYFDFMGMPYFLPFLRMMLPMEKCILAAHNVKTPKGARYYWMAKPYMDYAVRIFKNFQVFSLNQLELLSSIKRDANILYAPLCLKDYGHPTIEKPDNPITFLFFGNIVAYKRVDILLKAVSILNTKGINDFKVKICGYCRSEQWKEYEALISNHNIIETDIRRIPNEDIPNLFQSSHYFVMPYQDIAQSGAMTVALCYNLPIIASNLDTFKEFMNDGVDGYFFEQGNAEALAERMEYVLTNHNTIYSSLQSKQSLLVREILSNEAIINKYKTYINDFCR